MNFYDFTRLYGLGLLWTVIVLPRRVSNRIVETLFPILRRHKVI
jgi:hypothetical protein